jgi:hypothetical protein
MDRRGLRGHVTNMMNIKAMLRKSTAWDSTNIDAPPRGTVASYGTLAALPVHLEELLILEIRKDGSRQYMNLHVRALYKYIITAVTSQQLAAASVVGADEAVARPKRSTAPVSPVAAARPTVEIIDAPALPSLEDSHQPETVEVESGNESDDEEDDEVTKLLHPAIEKKKKRKRFSRGGSSSVRASGHWGHGSARRMGGTGKSSNALGAHGAPENAPVTYRERLGAYFHPRDMRRLVTPFSASNQPGIIVRRHVMLLNFDPLRAIILRDRLLVLVPTGADSFLVELERRVLHCSDGTGNNHPPGALSFGYDDRFMVSTTHGQDRPSTTSKPGADSGDSDSFDGIAPAAKGGKITKLSILERIVNNVNPGTDTETNSNQSSDDHGNDNGNHAQYNEWEEIERKEWINVPFELVCVDAVLAVVCNILSNDTRELKTTALGYIHNLFESNMVVQDPSSLSGEDPLTVIRVIKDAIREMDSRIKGFIHAMIQILDDDEDMALMNLSRLLTHPERFIQPVPQSILDEESDEPELILEAHIQTGYTLDNILDLTQGQIDTASELVTQKLDAIRNRLLYANMIITILSLCIATGSFVGSIFGMNLKNDIETNNAAFFVVTGLVSTLRLL